MSKARSVVALVLTCVLTAAAVGCLTLSRPARAEAPRTAECTDFPHLQTPKAEQAIREWVSAQVAAGRTNVVMMSTQGTTTGACAW